MEIVKQSGGCIKITHSPDELKQQYLIISDVHFDSVHCDRKLLKRDLDRAKERNAKILVIGDFYDSMQSRDDRRRNKSDIRPEHNTATYLDTLVDTAAEFLEPYKEHILLLSNGNHEGQIINKLETDLLERLSKRLGPQVFHGGYHGFIRFQFLIRSTSMRSLTMYYHHGNWGGVVNKGTQSIQRFAAITPDADIVVSGHIHERWSGEQARYSLTQNGSIKVTSQYHIKCSCYKQEFEQPDGWAIQTISTPKPLGGWWMSFEVEGEKVVPKFVMT